MVLCSGPPRIVRRRETKKRTTTERTARKIEAGTRRAGKIKTAARVRKIATTRGGKNQAVAGKATARRRREIKKGIRRKTKTRIKFPRTHE